MDNIMNIINRGCKSSNGVIQCAKRTILILLTCIVCDGCTEVGRCSIPLVAASRIGNHAPYSDTCM